MFRRYPALTPGAVFSPLFPSACKHAAGDHFHYFYDFRTTDSELNKRSAEELKAVCEEKQVKQVITSHSGILSASSAFSHMNESPAWREKGFVFCRDADENPYSM